MSVVSSKAPLIRWSVGINTDETATQCRCHHILVLAETLGGHSHGGTGSALLSWSSWAGMVTRNVRRTVESDVGVGGPPKFQIGFPGWGNQTMQRSLSGNMLSGFRNSVGTSWLDQRMQGDSGGR